MLDKDQARDELLAKFVNMVARLKDRGKNVEACVDRVDEERRMQERENILLPLALICSSSSRPKCGS
jgi:hypothetical protein